MNKARRWLKMCMGVTVHVDSLASFVNFTVVLLGFIFSKEKRNRLGKHFKRIQGLRVIGRSVVKSW